MGPGLKKTIIIFNIIIVGAILLALNASSKPNCAELLPPGATADTVDPAYDACVANGGRGVSESDSNNVGGTVVFGLVGDVILGAFAFAQMQATKPAGSDEQPPPIIGRGQGGGPADQSGKG